jgi:hypothetical protein
MKLVFRISMWALLKKIKHFMKMIFRGHLAIGAKVEWKVKPVLEFLNAVFFMIRL